MPTPSWDLSSRTVRFGAFTPGDTVVGGSDLLTPGALMAVAGLAQARQATVGEVIAGLGLSGLTAGALLFASGAATVDKLALGTAGRLMVAGASAPAWSDSGLSYASGVLAVAGSVPATPTSGQVLIGGGAIKAGGAISCNSLSVASGWLTLSGVGYGANNSLILDAATGTANLRFTRDLSTSLHGGSAEWGLNAYYSAGSWNKDAAGSSSGYLAMVPSSTAGQYTRLIYSGITADGASPSQLWSIGADGVMTAIGITSTGVIIGPNGTAAAPGIRLTSEPSGIYRVSASVMGLSVNGAATANLYTPAAGLYGGALLMQNPAADQPGVIGNLASNSFFGVYGGASLAGGALKVYGTAHATKPSYVEFTRGATVSAYIDNSGNLICNGTLTVPNGTAAAPGIRLTSEAHGLYRVGATTLGVAVAGVSAMTISAPGGTYGGLFVMATPSAAEYGGVLCSATNSYVILCGGTGAANSGQIRAYGSTHATKGDYVEFLRANTVSAYFDGSGILTLNNTTDASAIGTAAMVGLGGASIAKSLWVGATAGNYINIANATGELRVNGTKVVAARRTGWSAQTATAARTDLGAAPTVGAIASFLRALYDDLATHGLIGA